MSRLLFLLSVAAIFAPSPASAEELDRDKAWKALIDYRKREVEGLEKYLAEIKSLQTKLRLGRIDTLPPEFLVTFDKEKGFVDRPSLSKKEMFKVLKEAADGVTKNIEKTKKTTILPSIGDTGKTDELGFPEDDLKQIKTGSFGSFGHEDLYHFKTIHVVDKKTFVATVLKIHEGKEFATDVVFFLVKGIDTADLVDSKILDWKGHLHCSGTDTRGGERVFVLETFEIEDCKPKPTEDAIPASAAQGRR